LAQWLFTASGLLDNEWTRMLKTGVANVQKNAGETQRDVYVVCVVKGTVVGDSWMLFW
jgi:hypothetical protein